MSEHSLNDPTFRYAERGDELPIRAPVSVFGIAETADNEAVNGDFLGIGHIIGYVDGPEGPTPVIEITDNKEDDTSTTYTLVGVVECMFDYPPSKEIIEGMMEGTVDRANLDNYVSELRERQDRAWLANNGIDPSSFE